MTDRFRTAVRAFGGVVVPLLGVATFLVVNTLIALMAYQFETPWRQEDVRIPVAVVVLGVVLIAVVFPWWGRLFAVGFVGGLFIVAIWGPAWTRHWLDPGGTPRRDAALERTRPARAAAARRRAHDRWVAERRGTGMDES